MQFRFCFSTSFEQWANHFFFFLLHKFA